MVFGHISTDDCPYPKSFLVNAYFFFVNVVVVIVVVLLLFYSRVSLHIFILIYIQINLHFSTQNLSNLKEQHPKSNKKMKQFHNMVEE